MTLYYPRVSEDETIKSFGFFSNFSTLAPIMCHSSHRAVGKHLCKFHNKKIMLERSYLMRNFDF